MCYMKSNPLENQYTLPFKCQTVMQQLHCLIYERYTNCQNKFCRLSLLIEVERHSSLRVELVGSSVKIVD